MGSTVTITPDAEPNPQVTITPDASPPKKYLPGRQFGMEVAKGMGLDAEKIKAAEDAGGQEAGLKEIGHQVFEGLSGFAGSVLKDPFHAADPIHGMASSVEKAIKEKSPGQLTGALANILGGAEGASKTAEVAGKIRPKVGEMIHTPEGELTPGAEMVGKVGGGAAGAAAGAAVGHEYLGAAAGYKMGPSLMERLFPEPKTVAEARARAEAYQAKAEDLMRRGREQEALDRKASASQRLKDKLAAQAAKNAPKPSPFPGATPSDAPVGTADLPAPKAQQPFPQVVKKADVAPETSIFPEPRAAQPGDKPGAMWSVGREELPGAARRGAPGAVDVLRNLNKPIILTPKEGVGYPGPRPNLLMSETEMPLKDLAGDRPEIGEASPTERRQSTPYEREIFQKMLDNPEGEQLGQSMKAAREGSEGAASEGPARRLIGANSEDYARFRAAELAGDTATMREMLVKAKKRLAKVGR